MHTHPIMQNRKQTTKKQQQPINKQYTSAKQDLQLSSSSSDNFI